MGRVNVQNRQWQDKSTQISRSIPVALFQRKDTLINWAISLVRILYDYNKEKKKKEIVVVQQQETKNEMDNL